MKIKHVIPFLFFLISTNILAQDTLYVNQVLPDSIEIYDARYEYVNYVLIISEYRDSTTTHAQTRTVRLRIYPDRVVKVDDKVYYRISKKDKRL